jgi:ArsR family transcriptional regulator
MEDNMDLQKAENLLGALSNKKRLRLLKLLISFDEEICVCEFEDALNLPQYTVSRHLNKLKERGLVGSRREGTWAYYSLNSELRPAEQGIVNWIDQFIDEKICKEDKQEMEKRLSMRENGKCVATNVEKSSSDE